MSEKKINTMFEYLIEKHQANAKRIVSRWLKAYIIEPTLMQRIPPEAYLKGFDRKKAAESCYEYLVLTKQLNDSLLQVDKKKLVKDIAMYIDLRTPFIYSHKQFGTLDYQIDKQLLEEMPFHFKSNNRKATSLIQEAQKSMVLNHKTKWISEKPSVKQIQLIKNKLKKKKQVLRINIEEINKYQAAILIPYLVEKQIFDQEELQELVE
ncbi:hypothetical protein HRF69_00455 [Bacillus circulans]|uniref:hypothetical protein n=2 Tax=Bacillaceae TaxID=186817 RepID=UPI00155FA9E7|nr:hypothetical protein [Niallia circulans]NRG25602.1 hypothetical protein [Niallia circulans]